MLLYRIALLVFVAAAGMGLWLIGSTPGASMEMAAVPATGPEVPRMLGGLLLGGGLLGLVRLGHRTASAERKSLHT